MRSLICITTCNRLDIIKKYIWDYIAFCNQNEGFDFLLALDGTDVDYIQFCVKYQIPLLYSEEREGVGLSKNRVLKQFPNYDYYFFIEDDIELVNIDLFALLIRVSEDSDYQHLCNNHTKNQIRTEKVGEEIIRHSQTGGAQVALYTRKGLKIVGGWHTLFSKYKRFGHTEHTYRFMIAGLQPSPFIFPERALEMFIIHNPPRVTTTNIKTNDKELIEDEQNLIDSRLPNFPLETISNYYYNQKNRSFNKTVQSFLTKNKRKYPLTKGKERRFVFSKYYFFKFQNSNSLFSFLWFILSNICVPFNSSVKHYIKSKFKHNAQ